LKFITATDRYIFRLVMLPLLGTLAIAASLLLLEKMLSLFDFVAAEGGPVSVVWRMLANLIPEYLSLGIPIGLLLGILLAFRRLATSSELDIFRAVGMSYFRLLRVPFLFAITLAAVNFAIVGFIQPSARYLYEELRFELRSGAFGAKVRVGEFNNVGENLTVRIEESRDNGNRLSGMFVYAESKNGQSIAVSAEKGQFLRTDDPDTILLRLEKGTLVHDAPNYKTPRVLSFTSHDVPIPLPSIENFRARGGKDREYSITELVRIGGDAQKPADEAIYFEPFLCDSHRIGFIPIMLPIFLSGLYGSMNSIKRKIGKEWLFLICFCLILYEMHCFFSQTHG
jgi:lipopolysaccharide export system permease protein